MIWMNDAHVLFFLMCPVCLELCNFISIVYFFVNLITLCIEELICELNSYVCLMIVFLTRE